MNTEIKIGFNDYDEARNHNFTKATITGEELRKLLIENEGQRLICLRGLTIEGNLYLTGIEFAGEGEVNFSDAIFKDWVYFDKATFKGKVDFGKARFKSWVHFSYATFENEVDFGKAIFEKTVYFGEAVFESAVYFSNATFKSWVNFGNAIFKGKVNSGKAIFKGRAWFDNATLQGKLLDKLYKLENERLININNK